MDTASNAVIGWLGSSSRENRLLVTMHERSDMLNPQKTLEREQLLRRIRELDPEIAQQHERNIREGEARLPIEEQVSLKLRRFIEADIPELTVNVRVEKRR
jgi:hypothetical protein